MVNTNYMEVQYSRDTVLIPLPAPSPSSSVETLHYKFSKNQEDDIFQDHK